MSENEIWFYFSGITYAYKQATLCAETAKSFL